MRTIAFALGAVLMAALLQGVFAQELEVTEAEPVETEVVKPVADARVAAALKRLEIEYEVDEDGDYRIIVPCDAEGTRTQLVFVNSDVEKFGDAMEIREVWSVGYKNDAGVPLPLLKKAAKKSRDYKVGAWELAGSKDNRLMLVAKVPANLADDPLFGTIASVGKNADDFEMDTLGTDEL